MARIPSSRTITENGGHGMAETDVRWTMTDRGFKHYTPVTTKHGNVVSVYESSRAFEPHLWVDVDGNTMHLTLAEAAVLRDQPDQDERLKDTLAVAIRRHYQAWNADPEEWKAGDPCAMCGSPDTALEDNIAVCRSCGASDCDASDGTDG